MKTEKKKITKSVRDAYALVGSIGGRATAKKPGHMSRIGKKGAKKRWGSK